MKIRYNREVDILTDGKPVMLEIQGGREFLLSSLTSLVNEEEVRLP